MYCCFLIGCSNLCLEESRFWERKNIFYFTLCSFNCHFVFWSRWITELANTVILMPWRDSRGKKSHLPKEPVSCLNPLPFPEWAPGFKKHFLTILPSVFSTKTRGCHSSDCTHLPESKIFRELDLKSLNNISKIIF